MNKKLFGLMIGGLAFVLAAQVNALTVTGTGGLTVQATTTSVVVMSSTVTGNLDASSTIGLAAQVQAGSTTTSSEDSIVSLQGNSIGMIQTNADLDAYNTLVIKSRPAVTSVNVDSTNNVDVYYSQPARFLGIFSTSLSGDVHVDAQGNTTVNMPWYAFLYAKDTTNVKTSVATAVTQSGVQFGSHADAATTIQNNARVINAVSAAVQAQAQASASASTTGTASTY